MSKKTRFDNETQDISQPVVFSSERVVWRNLIRLPGCCLEIKLVSPEAGSFCRPKGLQKDPGTYTLTSVLPKFLPENKSAKAWPHCATPSYSCVIDLICPFFIQAVNWPRASGQAFMRGTRSKASSKAVIRTFVSRWRMADSKRSAAATATP